MTTARRSLGPLTAVALVWAPLAVAAADYSIRSEVDRRPSNPKGGAVSVLVGVE